VLIDAFLKQPDLEITALCDVDLPKVTEFGKKFNIKADIYQDYRRIMDRKDIDAVVVATPDHNHAPISIAAFETGKDVYLEKPVSNTVTAAVAILESALKYKRVVQVGTQQRSFTHFQECAKMIREGVIGDIQQVVVNHTGGSFGRAQNPVEAEPVPEGFDWELWQGPAARHPYSSARRRWRNYYEYGGGGITDWGVHHVDIVHLYMGVDGLAPSFTSGLGIPDPDPEKVPGIWSINYTYSKFLMTFVSAINPTPEPITDCPIFFGSKGSLSVNRWGYLIRPTNVGSWIMSMKGNQFNLGPSAESKEFVIDDEVLAERASEVVHVRNWLDCMKSRQKPTCDIETGFTSSLPLLVGVQSIRNGHSYTWDPITKTAKAV